MSAKLQRETEKADKAVGKKTLSSLDCLGAIQAEMNTNFLEMADIIEGMLVGLLAEQNLLLIGPPGSAKTQASQFLAKAIEGKFFDRLMHKFMVPDELFGPVDIVAMKVEKKFKRASANTLMDADIFLADEIWKSSSAIVNTLLRAVNEKEYCEDGAVHKLPLKLVIGCSNEYPTGEETTAIYDRFNIKYEAKYIQEDSNFKKLINMPDEKLEPTHRLTRQQFAEMVAAAKNLELPEAIADTIVLIRRELNVEGIVCSPRRWKKAIRVVKAYAYLNGHSKVEESDLMFLKNVLWNQSEQKSAVARIISKVVNPFEQKAMEILDAASEVKASVDALLVQGGDITGRMAEYIDKYRRMAGQLKKMRDEAVANGRSAAKIEQVLSSIEAWHKVAANSVIKL